MDQQRLSSLAVLPVRRSVPVDLDKVIDRFVSNGVGQKQKIEQYTFFQNLIILKTKNFSNTN